MRPSARIPTLSDKELIHDPTPPPRRPRALGRPRRGAGRRRRRSSLQGHASGTILVSARSVRGHPRRHRVHGPGHPPRPVHPHRVPSSSTRPAGVFGWMVFTAADGDQLRLDFEGQFISPTTAVGTYEFTGGTGRFRDATGTADFEAASWVTRGMWRSTSTARSGIEPAPRTPAGNPDPGLRSSAHRPSSPGRRAAYIGVYSRHRSKDFRRIRKSRAESGILTMEECRLRLKNHTDARTER